MVLLWIYYDDQIFVRDTRGAFYSFVNFTLVSDILAQPPATRHNSCRNKRVFILSAPVAREPM